MVFFRSRNIFFSLRDAAELFFSRHYFFPTKTIFLKAVLSEYFFLSMSETVNFFPSFADRKCFPPKNHSPPIHDKWMALNEVIIKYSNSNIQMYL